MNKLKQYFSLTIVCWSAVNLSQISLAQYSVPIQPPAPDMCGYREARCRRDSDGNIVDRKSGDVYDRKGNLLRRANGSTSSNGGQFNKAECDAAMNRRMQGVDMRDMLSDPFAFGKLLESEMSSIPACHK
jgi:hypothetical protein